MPQKIQLQRDVFQVVGRVVSHLHVWPREHGFWHVVLALLDRPVRAPGCFTIHFN